MFQTATNWIVGVTLIGLGLVHNLAGGPLVGRWLKASSPALETRDLIMGRAGFEFGGYLAMAIGLSFILLGKDLPRNYYLFWAVCLALIGSLSLYLFRSFHISQLVLILSALLVAYYLRSHIPVPRK